MDELVERINALETQVARPSAVTNVYNHTVNHVNNTVTINIFGHESVEHITQAHVRSLLDSTIEGRAESGRAAEVFVQTAMLIYSDPDHPENLTAYIPSTSRRQGVPDQVMVYKRPEPTEDGGEASSADSVGSWQMIRLEDAAPPMASQALNVLVRKQPFESGKYSLQEYSALLRTVFDREPEWARGKELRAVLVRNHKLIQRVFNKVEVNI